VRVAHANARWANHVQSLWQNVQLDGRPEKAPQSAPGQDCLSDLQQNLQSRLQPERSPSQCAQSVGHQYHQDLSRALGFVLFSFMFFESCCLICNFYDTLADLQLKLVHRNLEGFIVSPNQRRYLFQTGVKFKFDRRFEIKIFHDVFL